MRRAAIGVLLVVLALVVHPLAAVAAGVPDGQVGIRLLEAPVERAADPRAAGAIIDHLAPGSTISRRIEVASGLDRPVRIALYAAGAAVSAGAFRFFEGRTGSDASGWTSVSPSSIDLGPRSVAQAVVTIAVPHGASAGERYAVVWAELPSATSSGVAVVNRVGIRLYLSIGAGGEPPTDFAVETLTPGRTREGRPTVTARVRNTGHRALDLRGELRLQGGPGGLAAGPFAVNPGTTIGIGQSGDVVTELDPAIPRGPWTAAIVLRSGLVERSANARLRFPLAGMSAPVRVTGGLSMVPMVFALLLALGVAFWLFLILRRRRDERREAEAKAPRTVIPLEPRARGRAPVPGPYAQQAAASREDTTRKRSAGGRGGPGI